MLNNIKCLPIACLCFCLLWTGTGAAGQTASSLYRLGDNVQVPVIKSDTTDLTALLGQGGPAVENSHAAFRLFFNDSGSVDVYSKSGRGMELLKYGWHPSAEIREAGGEGGDNYSVGGTLGLGGIALRDGNRTVRIVATEGRTARAGDTSKGAFAELISYGVPYGDGTVDISVRIDVNRKNRVAKITATELSGKKVRFVTGVNYYEGQSTKYGADYISVWGVHPVDSIGTAVPVGAGLFFDEKIFSPVEKIEDMLRIISKPVSKIETGIVAASTLEAELNNARRFEAYMSR